MATKDTFSSVWMDTELLPVNTRLFTLQCGVLGDYFSYQTYLLITRQGCSRLERHVALSSQPRGGVVQQQLEWGLDYLDELLLIVLSPRCSLVCIKRHSRHACPCRNSRTNTRGWLLNPCCSCRVELWTQTRITACTKGGSYEQPKHNLRNVLMRSFAE